jgi:hypothetical protein
LLTLAGQLVTEAFSVVVAVSAADTQQAEVGADQAAKWVAAGVKLAPADPALAVDPLTTIAEACIIQTRAPDRCVLRFVNLLL